MIHFAVHTQRRIIVKYRLLLILILPFLLFSNECEECNRCKGKIDVAPTYLRMTFVNDGLKTEEYDLKGGRAALDYFLWKALLFRGTAIGAWDGANFHMYTAGLGLCLPYKQFFFTPTAGVTMSYFKDYNRIPVTSEIIIDAKTTFKSMGPYVGLDIQWCLCDTWRIGGGFQYSWSYTHTKIENIMRSTEHSAGPSWSFIVEHDLNKKWSVNLGGAINRSLNHERNGIKGQGVKLGLTYWL